MRERLNYHRRFDKTNQITRMKNVETRHNANNAACEPCGDGGGCCPDTLLDECVCLAARLHDLAIKIHHPQAFRRNYRPEETLRKLANIVNSCMFLYSQPKPIIHHTPPLKIIMECLQFLEQFMAAFISPTITGTVLKQVRFLVFDRFDVPIGSVSCYCPRVVRDVFTNTKEVRIKADQDVDFKIYPDLGTYAKPEVLQKLGLQHEGKAYIHSLYCCGEIDLSDAGQKRRANIFTGVAMGGGYVIVEDEDNKAAAYKD